MGYQLVEPNPWMILPFGLLLGAIALAPLFFPDWWARHYPKVAYSLGAVTLIYYVFSLHAYQRTLHVGHEYLSFIALIGSLFVVSGGIHIKVKGEATPCVNTLYLFLGALLANLLGTTGASMLLIRPWIQMNRCRITGYHIVFFIFIVSNVGGCLTPVGDPPLFLGYLKGIPFWWVAEHCWPMWAVGVGFLLALFYFMDVANYRRTPREIRTRLAEAPEQWRFDGLWNLAFLAVILGAVFLNHPPFAREALMVGAAVGSWLTTRKEVHEANQFNFHPIREVAILFIGIFATMIPALDWLQNNASRVGQPTPALFYWSSGFLSSLLDNAPTYLSFLSAAFGLFVDPAMVDKVQLLIQNHSADVAAVAGSHAEPIRHTIAALQEYHAAALASGQVGTEQIEVAFLLGNGNLNQYILAISIGAVFFGASTYIGNGPNFMVKAIADHQRIRTPGFLGYVFKYTLPCLAPMLVLIWLLFFRS
ncbi:MAG TPA: sodium:proton antiporter [Verrucomicrobiae bacterium]